MLGIERFKTPEAMFSPHLLGLDEPGLHEQIFTSIMTCDQDIRNDLYQNIVLAGGNTMFHGMKNRMDKDIKSLAPSNVTIRIKCPPERNFSAWMGGAMLSSLDHFKNLFIARQEYDELGTHALYRKCF
jgi:actin beta/gamma 1